MFREWTARRPWKERKRAARQRQIGSSKIGSVLQPPELIFYGKNSGVIGLTKDELYQSVHETVVFDCGYDKVSSKYISLSLLKLCCLIFLIVRNCVHWDCNLGSR